MTNYDKRFILAVLIIIGCFAYIFSREAYNDMVLGVLLTTGFGTIISFFFGSSDKKGKGDFDK
jgi:hypothetical protein